jgi:hypothetical protein
MNGELDFIQTSGTNWGPSIQTMLHQFEQAYATPVESRSQRDVLEDLERQMARFDVEFKDQLDAIRKCYVFANDPHLERFLRSHRTLAQILLEAAPHLRQHFGTDTVLTLRAPVDASGEQTLYAVVMWPGATKDVRAAIDSFDNAWWLGNVRRASGNLTITYELV